ncbi:MAG: hypothetical protein ABIP21_11125, partial [Acidimicrobiia bacterium]
DQLRVQNEQDRAHHKRLDRAIELLTMVIATNATPNILEPATSPQAEVADTVSVETTAPTVIGGSIDPTRLNDDPTVIDLTIDPSDALDPPEGAAAAERLRYANAPTVWTDVR